MYVLRHFNRYIYLRIVAARQIKTLVTGSSRNGIVIKDRNINIATKIDNSEPETQTINQFVVR